MNRTEGPLSPCINVGIDKIYLSPVTESDKGAFLEHFNEPEISENLHVVPYPFTENDAAHWVTFYEENRVVPETKLAIRSGKGRLIGEIGIRDDPITPEIGCEFGYWLARTWWNQGIMTATVRAFASYCLEDLGMRRIYAITSLENIASQRVLKKAGFTSQNLSYEPVRHSQSPLNSVLFARCTEDFK